MIPDLRSLLFAPADDERKLLRALDSDADAVVADLEDAVAPAAKKGAREVVARVFGQTRENLHPHPGRGKNPPPSRSTIPEQDARDRDNFVPISRAPLRLLRVNGATTEWFEDDLELGRRLSPDALVLPKATPEGVTALGPGGPPVIAIVETAAGLRAAYEIASAPRVAALFLGAVDLGAELGLEPRPDGQELLYARSQLVLDSAAAGIRPPFDCVHLATHDVDALAAECSLARSLGLRGKGCIHPSQVPVVNRLFAPSESELEWARGIVDAFERSDHGVLAVNGSMVDLPVVARARRVLREAERSEA